MNIQQWIERGLNPPGIRQPQRGALYRVIGRIGQVVADDINLTQRDFFAFTAGAPSGIKEHGEAQRIPRLPYDTDKSYQSRLAAGSFILDTTGEKGALFAFLNSYIPNRYMVRDYPFDGFRVSGSQIGRKAVGGDSRLVILVRDLTGEERINIEEFLSWFLGADIAYAISIYNYIPPSQPLTLNQVRERGGARWLETQFTDIAPVRADILSDDAFVIASGVIEKIRLYKGAGEIIVLACPVGKLAEVTLRLNLIIENSVQRAVSERKDIEKILWV